MKVKKISTDLYLAKGMLKPLLNTNSIFKRWSHQINTSQCYLLNCSFPKHWLATNISKTGSPGMDLYFQCKIQLDFFLNWKISQISVRFGRKDQQHGRGHAVAGPLINGPTLIAIYICSLMVFCMILVLTLEAWLNLCKPFNVDWRQHTFELNNFPLAITTVSASLIYNTPFRATGQVSDMAPLTNPSSIHSYIQCTYIYCARRHDQLPSPGLLTSSECQREEGIYSMWNDTVHGISLLIMDVHV